MMNSIADPLNSDKTYMNLTYFNSNTNSLSCNLLNETDDHLNKILIFYIYLT